MGWNGFCRKAGVLSVGLLLAACLLWLPASRVLAESRPLSKGEPVDSSLLLTPGEVSARPMVPGDVILGILDFDARHAAEVASIGSPGGLFVPKADTEFYDFFDSPGQLEDYKLPTYDSSYLTWGAVGSINDMANWMEFFLQNKREGRRYPRVVNASVGLSRVEVATQKIYPKLRKYVPAQARTEVLQMTMNNVNRAFDTDPAFAKAMARYRSVTRRAADAGIILVVSAGNDHQRLPEGVQVNPGDELSFFAQSEHVIVVGASDAKGRPLDITSWGTDALWKPTVTALGEGLFTSLCLCNRRGSSYANPQVSKTIRDVLKEAPTLTFEEIKKALAESAKDTEAPAAAEGAGQFRRKAFIQTLEQEYAEKFTEPDALFSEAN